MRLYLIGHEYKYAVEQMLLTMLPGERPEYPEGRPSGDRMEIGYAIHPDHQNQGYATEALRCVIQELFRMGFRHVRAGCFQENPASARVMVKCGMTLTGESEVIAYRGSSHVCVFYEISFVP